MITEKNLLTTTRQQERDIVGTSLPTTERTPTGASNLRAPVQLITKTKHKKLIEQLALFDALPDCAQVSIAVVCAIRGRSPASIWRDVSAGRIAKPVSAGPRCTRWVVGDLRRANQEAS